LTSRSHVNDLRQVLLRKLPHSKSTNVNVMKVQRLGRTPLAVDDSDGDLIPCINHPPWHAQHAPVPGSSAVKTPSFQMHVRRSQEERCRLDLPKLRVEMSPASRSGTARGLPQLHYANDSTEHSALTTSRLTLEVAVSSSFVFARAFLDVSKSF
jgi:hypothetical protein